MVNKKEIYRDIARLIAKQSKDPSTKVGAIIVDDRWDIVSKGYNGLPSKFPDDYEGMSKDTKYSLTIHAEVNCCINAARAGKKIEGCSIFVTHHPCSRCLAVLVNAGIKRVYVDKESKLNDNWARSLELSNFIYQNCPISIELI